MTFHPQIMIIININHTGWVHNTDWNTGCAKVAAEICRKHDFIIYSLLTEYIFFLFQIVSLFSLTQSRMSVLLFANKTFIFVHSFNWNHTVFDGKSAVWSFDNNQTREQSEEEVEGMRWRRGEEEKEQQIKMTKKEPSDSMHQTTWMMN